MLTQMFIPVKASFFLKGIQQSHLIVELSFRKFKGLKEDGGIATFHAKFFLGDLHAARITNLTFTLMLT